MRRGRETDDDGVNAGGADAGKKRKKGRGKDWVDADGADASLKWRKLGNKKDRGDDGDASRANDVKKRIKQQKKNERQR